MTLTGLLVEFYGTSTLGLFHDKNIFYFIPLLIWSCWKGLLFYLLKSGILLIVWIFKSECGYLLVVGVMDLYL